MHVCRSETVEKDIAELETSIARQRNAMARLNSQLAETKAGKAAVDATIFDLQGQLEKAAKVQSLLAAAYLIHIGSGLYEQVWCLAICQLGQQ